MYVPSPYISVYIRATLSVGQSMSVVGSFLGRSLPWRLIEARLRRPVDGRARIRRLNPDICSLPIHKWLAHSIQPQSRVIWSDSAESRVCFCRMDPCKDILHRHPGCTGHFTCKPKVVKGRSTAFGTIPWTIINAEL